MPKPRCDFREGLESTDRLPLNCVVVFERSQIICFFFFAAAEQAGPSNNEAKCRNLLQLGVRRRSSADPGTTILILRGPRHRSTGLPEFPTKHFRRRMTPLLRGAGSWFDTLINEAVRSAHADPKSSPSPAVVTGHQQAKSLPPAPHRRLLTGGLSTIVLAALPAPHLFAC
jgi:hypothetical protein